MQCLDFTCLSQTCIEKNSTDWLESNPQRDVEKIERDYMTIEHYDLKKNGSPA